MDTKQCKRCTKDFKPNSATQRYCSGYCGRRRDTIYPLQRECTRDECTVVFSVDSKTQRKRYCSQRCSAIVINGLGLPYPVESKNKCKRCEDPIPSGTRVYCQNCSDTRNEWQTQDRVTLWKSGDVSVAESKVHKSLSNWARNYMLDLAGRKCSECGWCTPNPILERPILTVDHIDGNWKNNQFDNLKVLCYNCHTLTPTFGNMNRGSESGMRPYAAERSRNGYTGTPRPKKVREGISCECGNSKSPRASTCSTCYSSDRSKNVPTKNELTEALLEYRLVFSRVGSHFGVSDNAVRKWCRRYELPTDKELLREVLTHS